MKWFNKIPGNSGLFINDDLVIKRLNAPHAEVLPTDGSKVLITLFGEPQWCDKKWLSLISGYGMYNEALVKHATFHKIKNKKRGFQLFVTTDKPIYVDTTHRIVPNFPTVAVNSDGTSVISVATLKPIYINASLSNYSFVTCPIPLKITSELVGVHRLVASAWCHNDDPEQKFVVNHLDGNPRNNAYTNLEWTTYKGNSVHAATTGLHAQTIKCRVLDAYTKEIREFISVKEAGRHYGWPSQNLDVVISLTRKNHLYRKRYEVKLEGDDTPWFYLTRDPDKVVARAQHIFLIEDPATGEETEIYGIVSLIRTYKLWNNHYNNSKDLMIRFRKLYPDLKISCTTQGVQDSHVEWRNLKTGEAKRYPSLHKMSRDMGWDTATIRTYLAKGESFGYRGYQIRHASDRPWPECNLYVRRRDMRVTLKDKKTHTYLRFSSLRDAEKQMGISRDIIRRMIDRPNAKDPYFASFTRDRSPTLPSPKSPS